MIRRFLPVNRLKGSQKLLRCFSKTEPVAEDNLILQQIISQLESDETLLSSNSRAKNAIQYFEEGSNRLARDILYRAKFRNATSFEDKRFNLAVDQKIADIEIEMGSPYAVKKLDKIITDTQALYSSIEGYGKYMVYPKYQKLLNHLLKTNVDRAESLSKSLVNSSVNVDIPSHYEAKFKFILGTAYLLDDDLTESKRTFREILLQEPTAHIKGYTLSNLATACWWEKYPNYHNYDPQDFEEEDDDDFEDMDFLRARDKDFEQVIPLYKNSLFFLEDMRPKLDSKLGDDMLKFLKVKNVNQDTFDLYEEEFVLNFKNPESGTVLLNIAEFIFTTQSRNQIEAVYWLKHAIRFFEENEPEDLERQYTILGLLWLHLGDTVYAEGLFKKALEILDRNHNKVFCLKVYGNMLRGIQGREIEGEIMVAEAYELYSSIPVWSKKLLHVMIDEELV